MRRKPTLVKRDADATALRKAVQRSDPKALSDSNKLPEQDMSERRMFLFYQDEGGMRATGPDNEDLGVIYYLVSPPAEAQARRTRPLILMPTLSRLAQGIIDILTPYTFVKRVEHFFKGFKHPRVGPLSLFTVARVEADLSRCLAVQDMISAVPPKRYGDRFLSVSLKARLDALYRCRSSSNTEPRLTHLSAAFTSSFTRALSAMTRLRVPACMSTIQCPYNRRRRRQSTRAGSRRPRSNERPSSPSTPRRALDIDKGNRHFLPFTPHTRLHSLFDLRVLRAGMAFSHPLFLGRLVFCISFCVAAYSSFYPYTSCAKRPRRATFREAPAVLGRLANLKFGKQPRECQDYNIYMLQSN